ncbi:MAG: hypothetical protein ACRED9_08220 [Caulobacteraceae bacterium]
MPYTYQEITKADTDAGTTYSMIMEECIVRLHSIQMLLLTPRTMRPSLVREYGYLQLRFCCELVALACLIAHGDIKATQTKQLSKAYVPGEILRRLTELHPDFYPVRVKITVRPSVGPGDPGEVHLGDFEKKYLDKAKLIALWGKCGNFLHKGSLRRLQRVNENHRSNIKLDDLVSDAQLMLNLFESHRISRKGNLFHFLAYMKIVDWNTEHASISPQVWTLHSRTQSS